MLKKFEPTSLVLGILVIICAIVFFFHGLATHKEYLRIKDNLISIPAVVSKISVHEDTDGRDSYYTCVTYEYEYEEYRHVLWKSGKYDIGQKVNITINPDAPSKPYNYSGNLVEYIVGTAVLLAIAYGMIAFSLYLKKDHKESTCST